MMKQIPLIALGLALVFLVSGCVNNQPVKVATNDGIKITEFSADADRFANTDPVALYMRVENEGGTTARNVDLEIIGASWAGVISDSSNGMSLSPPDLTLKPATPGEFKIFAPQVPAYTQLPEGVEADIDLTGRATYDYASNGEVTVHVLNKDEYRRRIQMSRPMPSPITVFNSNGPIHIDIDTRGLEPVVGNLSANTPAEVPLTIYIKNVGSGAPITNDVVGDMNVNLDLAGSGATFVQCLDTKYPAGTISVPNLAIKLRRGESYTIPCTVRVNTPLIEDAFSVIFSTNYRYFVEQPLTITIVGAPAQQ